IAGTTSPSNSAASTCSGMLGADGCSGTIPGSMIFSRSLRYPRSERTWLNRVSTVVNASWVAVRSASTRSRSPMRRASSSSLAVWSRSTCASCFRRVSARARLGGASPALASEASSSGLRKLLPQRTGPRPAGGGFARLAFGSIQLGAQQLALQAALQVAAALNLLLQPLDGLLRDGAGPGGFTPIQARLRIRLLLLDRLR